MVGRKELEEFAIIRLGLVLNRAMGRRDNPVPSSGGIPELWGQIQTAASQLLSDGSREFLAGSNISWAKYQPPKAPGVYRVHGENNGIVYIGETSDLKRRHYNHSTLSRGSALRRHVGTELLGLEFEKPKTLSKQGEGMVSEFLSRGTIFGENLMIGRYELEDRLIKDQNPLLNRKGKKKLIH